MTLRLKTNKNNIMIKSITKNPVFGAAIIALCFIFFMWGFWTDGVFAMGINASLVSVLFLAFLHFRTDYQLFSRKNIIFSLPVLAVAASFQLYENPFLKTIDAIVWIFWALFVVAVIRADFLKNKKWTPVFFFSAIGEMFSFKSIGASTKEIGGVFSDKRNINAVIKKVALGLVIFLGIALLVVPMLAVVDAEFSAAIATGFEVITSIISSTTLTKIFFFILAVVALTAIGITSQGRYFAPEAGTKKEFDSIVSGTILFGLLGVYLLFLYFQIEKLFVSALPTEFAETESLVKNGFWQLVFVSTVNVSLFVVLRGRTNRFVQKTLFLFGLASMLILASAINRLGMYVFFHGFSYEKFFAVYTVIFIFIVLSTLLTVGFLRKNFDFTRFLVVLFSMMFGLVHLFPIEKFIFNMNYVLSQRNDSRIEMKELTMLSSDVRTDVESYLKKADVPIEEKKEWETWVSEKRSRTMNKKWFEKNLSDL